MTIRADADAVIAFLNELVRLDELMLRDLIANRVTCNEAVQQHPFIQVGQGPDGRPVCGLLGILNGYCGVIEGGPHDGWGPISMLTGADGTIRSFVRTPEAGP